MFSSRLNWNLPPNKLSLLLAEKRAAVRRGEGSTILDLTESNPTRAGFSYPAKEILQAFANPHSLIYEPSPAGLFEARAAVSSYYSLRGKAVAPEQVLLTASTSEAYSYLFKLLADPGDEVLVPRPSYPLFGYLAEADSMRVVQYSLVYDGVWGIDFDALSAAVTTRTRAVVLVNPNNPTGSFLKRFELQKLLDVCAENKLAIISDEVFADYFFAPDPDRVSTLAGVRDVLTFSMSGLSKIAGLPQMKLGWIVIGGPDALRGQAMERLELIADTYLSVSTPAQHAFPALMTLGAGLREQIALRVRDNLDFLLSATGGNSSCGALAVEGGWYATLRIPRTRSEEEWCLELLEKDSVLVQPGFFYDFESEAFLILSLLTERGIFREGITRLLARVESGAE